mmetsp:Transcript_47822/g.119624  ORF Transcript_47822/g.119624 Transcript_47822/m.119624 type:complete len:90 (-) Transcript_47822:1246-1515(-)
MQAHMAARQHSISTNKRPTLQPAHSHANASIQLTHPPTPHLNQSTKAVIHTDAIIQSNPRIAITRTKNGIRVQSSQVNSLPCPATQPGQ